MILVLLNILEILWLLFLIHFFLNKSNSAIVKEPIVLFTLFFILIHFYIGITLVGEQNYRYQNSYSMESMLISNFLVFLYVNIVILTYYMRSGFKTRLITRTHFFQADKKRLRIIIFLLLLPALISMIYLFIYISQFNYIMFLANRIILLRGKGYLIITPFLMIPVLSILFINILHGHEKHDFFRKISFTFLFLITISFFLMMGSRNSVFILFLTLLVTYLFFNQKKVYSQYKILLLIVFLAFSFSYFGSLRQDIMSDRQIQQSEGIVSTINSGLVKNFGNLENLYWLNDHIKDWDYLYGKTFMAGFLSFIPRAIWEEKPLGGGPALTNMIKPGGYDVEGSNISSTTTGLVAEVYMNFGVFGIIMIAIIHGLLLLYIKKKFIRKNMNSIDISLYVLILLYLSFIILYSEFLGGFSRFLYILLPLYLISRIKLKYEKRLI